MRSQFINLAKVIGTSANGNRKKNIMPCYTKLTYEEKSDIKIGRVPSNVNITIKKNLCDMDMQEMFDMFEELMLAAGYQPDSINEYLCTDDNNCCEGCEHIPDYSICNGDKIDAEI